MFNNPYINNYNPQASIDRINAQINELEKMKTQMQQPIQPAPTNLTQNFQIAPTNNHTVRYANTIEDVAKEQVFYDTPFFSKDMSVLWFKSAKGDIKTYELNEIIPKDEKDLQIEYLQSQIEELKGKINNEQSNSNVDAKQNATNTTTNDETVGEPIKESKSTSVSRVSTSKKK
jgi:prefoldin subunit 5